MQGVQLEAGTVQAAGYLAVALVGVEVGAECLERAGDC